MYNADKYRYIAVNPNSNVQIKMAHKLALETTSPSPIVTIDTTNPYPILQIERFAVQTKYHKL